MKHTQAEMSASATMLGRPCNSRPRTRDQLHPEQIKEIVDCEEEVATAAT